jgi:hypothetical protein
VTTEEQLEAFLRDMSVRGVHIAEHERALTPRGVVFAHEDLARLFARQYDLEVVPLGSRWLARVRGTPD